MIEGLTWLAVRAAAKKFIGQNWEILLLVALIAGGLWWIDHRGYERAQEQDQAREQQQQLITATVVRQIDQDLGGKLGAIASSSSDKIQTIETEGKTVVQPIITRELVRDPALGTAGSCLTPSLLEAVNAARGYGTDELTVGGVAVGPGDPAPVPASATRP